VPDVADFLRAPVAALMFVLADRAGLGPDDLANPATASVLASTALNELNPWSSGDDRPAGRRARALELVKPLRPLVDSVVNDARNAWWSDPGNRCCQVHLTDDDRIDPMHVVTPTGPVTGWEIYAQKPARRLETSTELAVAPGAVVVSGAHAALAHGPGDWFPDYPLKQARLSVSDDARVYEINRPEDWHRLAVRYGEVDSYPGPNAQLLDTAGIDHGPAPTWSAVAADWDGVHLTLAGMLTSIYVPVSIGDTTTTLWAWEFERTLWLKPVFTAATPLPPLEQAPHGSDFVIPSW
jgi:hypothetical protein